MSGTRAAGHGLVLVALGFVYWIARADAGALPLDGDALGMGSGSAGSNAGV